MTPSARTLQKLKSEGWIAQSVEKWIPQARIRRDLFGCLDIEAVREVDDLFESDGNLYTVRRPEHLYVQCTSGSNAVARVKKVEESEGAAILARLGCRVEVWAWRKIKPRGETRPRWEVRIIPVEFP